jgi:1-acyl-sn-glycerol-3-phosphate acyltransferase
MSYFFWKTYWKLSGWQFTGSSSNPPKKMVLIMGPHTSWKDMVVGLAAKNVLQLGRIKFLGKKELFRWPFGGLLRRLGGVPVDRSVSHSVVKQVVDQFNQQDELIIGMMPEGTRKKVKKLRTGFYFIAKNANVPIIMIGLDFASKQLIISEPFFVTGNEAADFIHIHSFFASVQGKYPELGLSHLEKELQLTQ